MVNRQFKVRPLRKQTEKMKLAAVLVSFAETNQKTIVYSVFQIRVVSVVSTIIVQAKQINASILYKYYRFSSLGLRASYAALIFSSSALSANLRELNLLVRCSLSYLIGFKTMLSTKLKSSCHRDFLRK